MAQGPAPIPAYDRYRALGYGPGVYLIETGDVVKVGRAYSVATRLQRLHLDAEGAIGRVEVFGADSYCDLDRKERACIAALREVAKVSGRKREYFTDISYDDALTVVRAAIEAA